MVELAVAVWLVVGFCASLASMFFLKDEDFELTYGVLIGCAIGSVFGPFWLFTAVIWGLCWCFETEQLRKKVFKD